MENEKVIEMPKREAPSEEYPTKLQVYVSPQEAQALRDAAAKHRVTISNFIATAALEKAKRAM